MALRKERSDLEYDPILSGLSTAKEFDSWLALMRCLSHCYSVEHFLTDCLLETTTCNEICTQAHFHTAVLLVG